ncbi:DUF3993 domain-containing protein [Bacillus sp. FJAT-27986]|uniref:DUF3993 domain-containing protein n=1 Tax=Bacillus sp. FJAT-27986 TaxID=1743146 RepID=UPI00080AFC47|nr:DUF3993 domain-containing protein [Bacillus sp. FJAT-27986]OCA89780.1 hypothetical protein A8L44_02240 [Bacillus sp. FJAT-27986]
MKKVLTSLFITMLVLAVSPLVKVDAKSTLDKQDAFNLLDSAFQLQVSLSEKPRSMDNIRDLLKNSFSEEYTEDFINMNVQKSVDGSGYQTYGTDIALYYIPFFTYSEHTKLGYSSANDQWYVYEWFPGNTDGPVSYEGHYEAIGLMYDHNKWVINDYQIAFDPKTLDDSQEIAQNSSVDKEPSNPTFINRLTDYISYGFINHRSHWFGMIAF